MVIKHKWAAGQQAPETRVLNYPHSHPYTFRLQGHKYYMPIMVTLSDPNLSRNTKLCARYFVEPPISRLTFREWLRVILFASAENWGLVRAVYFSWCLSGINKKKIGGQFLVSLKFSSGHLDSFCPASLGLTLGLWPWRRESRHWIACPHLSVDTDSGQEALALDGTQGNDSGVFLRPLSSVPQKSNFSLLQLVLGGSADSRAGARENQPDFAFDAKYWSAKC